MVVFMLKRNLVTGVPVYLRSSNQGLITALSIDTYILSY